LRHFSLSAFGSMPSCCWWELFRSPGRRTVGSALRAMGLDQFERFHRYHRVLSHARWSSLAASRILLGLLLEAFVGEGPLILGIDETLERRATGRRSRPGASTATLGPFYPRDLR
jgi:DDE superfamily endonuclease